MSSTMLLILSGLLVLIILVLSWRPRDTSMLYAKHPFLLFGHRGCPHRQPENTLVSFKQAVADGCNAIELDVHRSLDGHLIVIHDDTLERTTNGSGLVAEHTLAELKQLNAAQGWEGRFEEVPSLEEVVATFPGDTLFNFEIKNLKFFSRHHLERDLVKFVQAHNLSERVILSSFNPVSIWRVKRADPNLFTAYLWYNEGLSRYRHSMALLMSHPDILHPCEDDITWEVRFWARLKSLPLHVWVVNDPARMKAFAEAAFVKGIMSDDTELLISTLSGN